MTNVASLLEACDELWPPALAEAWDTPGVQVGNRANGVSRCLLTVDVTPAVLAEAVSRKCDSIVSHHPLLLRGVTAVDEANDRGFLIAELTRAGISHIAAHTNADVVAYGVSDLIGRALSLHDLQPIEVASHSSIGIGRVGVLTSQRTLGELAHDLATMLPETVSGLRIVGPRDASISRIALCGGAGDSLLTHPQVLAADVYITSDLRHHPAVDAKIRAELGHGPWLIEVSHWASESLWLAQACADLADKLPSVEFIVSEVSSDPWDWRVE